MKTEESAGGIIVRNADGIWEVLVISDMNNNFTFPKGLVEASEAHETAARREIQEEVGLNNLTLLTKLPTIHYMYKRNSLIRKTVHYFLFKSAGEQKIVNQQEEGIHNAQWTPIERAIKIIGYPKTNKQLLIWTLKKLRTLKK